MIKKENTLRINSRAEIRTAIQMSMGPVIEEIAADPSYIEYSNEKLAMLIIEEMSQALTPTQIENHIKTHKKKS